VAGTWAQIHIRKLGTNLHVYKDGSAIAGSPFTVASYDGPMELSIGRRGSATTDGIDAEFTEIIITSNGEVLHSDLATITVDPPAISNMSDIDITTLTPIIYNHLHYDGTSKFVTTQDVYCNRGTVDGGLWFGSAGDNTGFYGHSGISLIAMYVGAAEVFRHFGGKFLFGKTSGSYLVDVGGDVNIDTGYSYRVNAIPVVGAQAAVIAATGTPTSYTAHASGAVAVTSNAATDLDTVAAALATLENEFSAHVVLHNDLLAKLKTHGLIASA